MNFFKCWIAGSALLTVLGVVQSNAQAQFLNQRPLVLAPAVLKANSSDDSIRIEHFGRITEIEYPLSDSGLDNLSALKTVSNWPKIFPVIKRLIPISNAEHLYYFKIHHLQYKLAFIAKVLFSEDGNSIELTDIKPFNSSSNPGINLAPENITLTWKKEDSAQKAPRKLRCLASVQWNLNMTSSAQKWLSNQQARQLSDSVSFFSNILNRTPRG